MALVSNHIGKAGVFYVSHNSKMQRPKSAGKTLQSAMVSMS